MLVSVGLDPDNGSEDITTAIGIGNVAGRRVAEARERDGMNQLGDEGGRKYLQAAVRGLHGLRAGEYRFQALGSVTLAAAAHVPG